jgi:hypothetical protein
MEWLAFHVFHPEPVESKIMALERSVPNGRGPRLSPAASPTKATRPFQPLRLKRSRKTAF